MKAEVGTSARANGPPSLHPPLRCATKFGWEGYRLHFASRMVWRECEEVARDSHMTVSAADLELAGTGIARKNRSEVSSRSPQR
jgi:hypothetical protein